MANPSTGSTTDYKNQPTPFEDEDFASMLEESFKGKGGGKGGELKENEIVKGSVVQVTKDYAVVDIGYKSEGQVPIQEFGLLDGKPNVKVGDKVDVLLESRENDTGMVVLSKEKADKMRIWDEISAACERDELVEGTIVGRVKGGLSVDIGVKAFLPGSQVDLRPIRNLDKLIGEKYKFKVIKFNKKRGNIVLSRRVLLEKEREELKKDTLQKLKEGAVLTGIVKNLTDYGAFIDLGGIDGLLHITDMSWGRVGHPSEMLNVGDELRVTVLKFDPATERVSLGLKQIQEDPWAHAAEKYPPGTRVGGKVVSLTDYGAFIEMEPGVEGLVHISEMSWTKRVKHPSKVMAIGDQVNAVVLDVDGKAKRISLGMKQIEPNPWTLLEEQYPIGSVIRGQVRNVTDFGIFVGVQEGIDGLVHVSDISWTQRIKHPGDLFKKGDEVEAVVLNIDVENERFSLGIKQLHPDPWTELPNKYPIGSRVKGKVTKVADFGAFVEIEPGIEMDPHERKVALSVKAALHEGDDYREYMRNQGTGRASLGEVFGEKLGGRKGRDR
jgi:small subunit ribosomal protein S1